jgi:hypothetical protein
MVRHQHIGMDFTSGFSGIFTQPIQIDAVVIIRKETRLAIVATLDDMNWNIRQCESGAAWHGIALVNLSPEPSTNRGLSPIFYELVAGMDVMGFP